MNKNNQKKLDNYLPFKKVTTWVCPNCGGSIESEEEPASCPYCGYPKPWNEHWEYSDKNTTNNTGE